MAKQSGRRTRFHGVNELSGGSTFDVLTIMPDGFSQPAKDYSGLHSMGRPL